MSRLGRAAWRGVARLIPAERRDWAEAIWAEAREVPPGLRRLAWRAGGIRLMAMEASCPSAPARVSPSVSSCTRSCRSELPLTPPLRGSGGQLLILS
jgi:hypothetical protein